MLLSAFCKDNWVGALLAFIVIDFITNQNSSLWKQLIRLSSFTLLISVIILRTALISTQTTVNLALGFIRLSFYWDNLLWGLILPFIPGDLAFGGGWQPFLRITILITLLVIPFWLIAKPNNQLKAFLLLITALTLLLGMSAALMFNQFWRWMQLPPLADIAAAILGFSITKVSQKLGWWSFGIGALYLVAYLCLSRNTLSILEREVNVEARERKAVCLSLRNAAHIKPYGKHYYIVGGEVYYLTRENFLPHYAQYTRVFMKNKHGTSGDEHILMGDIETVKKQLKQSSAEDGFRILAIGKDRLYEYKTGEIRAWLNDSLEAPSFLIPK